MSNKTNRLRRLVKSLDNRLGVLIKRESENELTIRSLRRDVERLEQKLADLGSVDIDDRSPVYAINYRLSRQQARLLSREHLEMHATRIARQIVEQVYKKAN